MKSNVVSASATAGALIAFTSTVATAAVVPNAAPTPCSLPRACALYSNTSSGPALEGASASGIGLFGTSSSGLYYDAGVDGESSNPDGEDAGGAFGANTISTGVAPEYGVISYGTGYGVVGEENSVGTSTSNAGYGVFGQDNTGVASTHGDYNIGVAGESTVGTAVLGESNGSPILSSYGGAPVGVYAVADTASGTQNSNAFALFGESNSFGLDLHNTVTNAFAYVLSPGDLFYAFSSTGKTFSVDNSANMVISGTLTTSKGGPYVRTTDAGGATRTEYSERTTVPQMEDVGEGQLANGRAYVRIDRDLASTIDRRTSYHVFVTPEGDCNQLYVTQKSTAGFEVRESHGGRSTLAFEYRIVAKPLGEDGARLAIAAPLRAPDADGIDIGRKARNVTTPVPSPQDRLKRRMGTQAFAQAMLVLRARRQGAP